MTRASGVHLIADLACTRGLGDVALIEAALREAATWVKADGVTVDDVHPSAARRALVKAL